MFALIHCGDTVGAGRHLRHLSDIHASGEWPGGRNSSLITTLIRFIPPSRFLSVSPLNSVEISWFGHFPDDHLVATEIGYKYFSLCRPLALLYLFTWAEGGNDDHIAPLRACP